MNNDKYKKWDSFIHEMLIYAVTAQKKFRYIVLDNLDPNEPYDLFFFKINLFANTFVKGCKLYGCFLNIFKYFKFKCKEQKVCKVPAKIIFFAPNDFTHICSREERVQLIEEVAKKYNIHPEDIATIYKEYYSK